MNDQFQTWLERLLLHGQSFQSEPPRIEPGSRSGIQNQLQSAFNCHALDVAGPRISFDPSLALDAAFVVAQACWRLLAGTPDGSPPLTLDREPATASAHLSVDVVLRFLAPVTRRARTQEPAGSLAVELEELLRAWPLSGVLADLDGEAAKRLDFDGHAGLQLLYAERYAGSRRAGWLPPPGPSREWVERVFHERRLSIPSSTSRLRDS